MGAFVGPPPNPNPPASAQSLMGQAPAQAPPDTSDQAQTVIRQIRSALDTVETLSRQFPAAASTAPKIREGLMDMMNRIVGSLNQGREPEAPRFG